MSNDEIAKAWKDDEYREQLSKEKQEQLPASPVGEITLSEEELKGSNAAAAPDTTWASVIVSIISAASVAECTSVFSGGTCHVDTAGCC
ncbi:MAG TPA: mersacidin/lichenicidin family type 2 lantibiotic [Ktedonobacteraceae bacterium]|nr:mersacidin/lichenicidin family type 2 lantibiotic [Ktedonobacteraceae bacterium]